MRNYQRSASDVRNSNAEQPNNETINNTSNNKQSSDNFKLISRPSQTTVLTNISRLESDMECCNDKIGNNDNRSINKEIIRRNDKYFNRILKMFKLNNPTIESEIFVTKQCNNSISNSSLQDLDQTEFSSSDLVKYMEEINDELTT